MAGSQWLAGLSVTAIGGLPAAPLARKIWKFLPRRPCQAHHTLPVESVAETTLMSAPGSVVIRSIGDHWFAAGS